MGVINSTQSHNLCNTWNICMSTLIITGTAERIHQCKDRICSCSSTTVLIWAARSPEAQGTEMGLPRFCSPEVPQPPKLTLPPSLGDAQINLKFAAGTGELMEGSQCEWPSQPGLTTAVPQAHGCINLLQNLTGAFIQAACGFGLQHKYTPPKSNVLKYYSPWPMGSMTKRFLESDIARHYYFTIYVMREPQSLRHSQRSHCSKCCASTEISQTSRYLYLS